MKKRKAKMDLGLIPGECMPTERNCDGLTWEEARMYSKGWNDCRNWIYEKMLKETKNGR